MKDTTTTQEPVAMPGIKGDAGIIHVDDAGSGGIPVLFVHSFGGSSHNWDDQLEHLRKERRAIAMDLRGHGQSQAPADTNYNVAALESDIEAVVDSLHLQRFILVGHSMGGSAGVAYAGAHPDRVAGLVLAGTPGAMPKEQSTPVIRSLENDSTYQQVMDDYMKKLLTNAKPATEKEINEGIDKISKGASLNIIRSLFEFDPAPMLKKYNGPLLIIAAEGENPASSLQSSFPAAAHVTIKGTSHWTQMDKPDEFNKILDAFLQKIK